MTHYETLGVSESANPDEIKRAYRKLASQHHPDKGGDTKKFQEIQTAYDTLQDPAKREQYDFERQNPGGNFRFNVNGHEMHGMPPHVADMFKNFGFNFGGSPNGDPFGQARQPRRNKDMRVEVPVTLASTLEDQTKTVSIQTTNGQRETVEVRIPRGVGNGTQIKYPNLGDNFFNTLERGDLYVVVLLQPHPPFEVHGLDVHTVVRVDCITAMVCGDLEVTGIDGSKFTIGLPAGSQPDTMFRIHNQGVWQLNGSTRGNLIVKIVITIPKNLSPDQLALATQLKQSL
jgi:DnaJ-class molecular chaperone